MALVTTREMFKKAYEGGYAVGAFNINNMEIVQAITEAAAELKSPVILQASAGARKYAKPAYLRDLAKAAVEETGVDFALHLDHGADFETCKSCIDGGFTSVMIDGSKHSFEDNIIVKAKSANLQMQKMQERKKKMKKNTSPSASIRAALHALRAIIVLWFFGAAFGMVYAVLQLVLSPATASMDSLLTYIGAPMSVGVLTYLIKIARGKKSARGGEEQNPVPPDEKP